MGLADRDYMRERHREEDRRNPFSPPAASGLRSTIWAVACWASIAYLLFKGFAWWEQQRKPAGSPPPTVRMAPAAVGPQIKGPDHLSAKTQEQGMPTQRTTAEGPAGGASREITLPPQTGANVVSKCVVNGVVTYSDRECSGRASRQVPIDPNANLADGMPGASAHFAGVQPRAGQIVYRTSGAVDADLPPGTSTSDSVENQTRCAALEQEVRALDAAARHALPAFEQDRLAARRKLARDAQFRLHC